MNGEDVERRASGVRGARPKGERGVPGSLPTSSRTVFQRCTALYFTRRCPVTPVRHRIATSAHLSSPALPNFFFPLPQHFRKRNGRDSGSGKRKNRGPTDLESSNGSADRPRLAGHPLVNTIKVSAFSNLRSPGDSVLK